MKPLECPVALGMKNGAILDKQISSSSEYSENHAAVQGRFGFRMSSSKAGSWVAGKKDASQWLQIDLANHYTKVTGAATQGRQGYSQWVKKYNLQYSNNGTSFKYYKEQGQSVHKVK